MKRILSVAAGVFIVSVSSAQLSYQSAEKRPVSEEKDTSNIQLKKILIIPYEPKMHLSDADNQIAEYSERNPREIRAMFRTGMTNQLQASLMKVYPAHSMLANLTPEGMKALDDVYRYVDYSYDTVYSVLYPGEYLLNKGISTEDSTMSKRKLSTKEKRANEKAIAKMDPDDKRYMNVKVIDPNLIRRLCEKFDVNEVVFLGQMEIKTKFTDCLDPSLNTYNRAIKVHYSVFDNTGKQVYGGIAKTLLPSDANEIGEIMTQAFPALSDEIKDVLNPPKAPATALK